MAPTNFDKQFKNALESRRIEPSKDAWKNLESQLEDSKESKSLNWMWLAVAASIMAIAIVSYFNFQNEGSDVENAIQQVETNESIPNADEINSETENIKELITPKSEGKEEVVDVLVDEVKEEIENVQLIKSKTVSDQLEVKNEVAQNDQNVKDILPNEVLPKTIEEEKIAAIVETMKTIDSTDLWSVDSEVDALLAEAQRKIKLEKLYEQALQQIDAQALLNDIEEDLEESFRSKVFKALKESYNEVKTAVAERNN
ncbi:MAG: hypothetical protein ACWA5P_04040 [bacterium]